MQVLDSLGLVCATCLRCSRYSCETRFVGKLLHTGQINKMISSYIGGFILFCCPLRIKSLIPFFLETSILNNFIFKGRYPWNSYHKVPSPNVYALTLRGYLPFLRPPAHLLRWRKARYQSVTMKAAYPKGLRYPGSPRSIVSSMGEDTCSNTPLREMLHL